MIFETLVVLGYVAIQIVRYVIARMNYWSERRKFVEENQEYINQVQAMDAMYAPEPPDVELAEKCGNYLAEKFPSGIEAAVQSMSNEELMGLFLQIENDAEQLMGVSIDNVDFYESETPPTSTYFGYYNRQDNSLHINRAFILSGDPRLVREQVSTIFHELKHARQWKAIENCLADDNTFGYSEQQIMVWAENFKNYIPCALGDEIYRKQPVERDSFGFERRVMEIFENSVA